MGLIKKFISEIRSIVSELNKAAKEPTVGTTYECQALPNGYIQNDWKVTGIAKVVYEGKVAYRTSWEQI